MSAPPWPLRGALVALSLLLCVWPWPRRPDHLIGHPDGEVANHARMLWRAGQRLGGVEGPLGNLPLGTPQPLMDPINLPPYLLGALADPALGLGFVVVFNLALAGLGAAALARALGGGPAAGLTAAVAGITAPFLGGVVAFGITEALPAGWMGLHLAFALRALRGGSPWLWLASAGALAAFALAGWYHVVFLIPLELGLLGLAWRRGGARGLAAALASGALAAAPLAPRLARHLQAREVWEGRFDLPVAPPVGAAEAWRHQPFYGADLLNLVLPAQEAVPVSKSVYLGLVVLALALAGARRAPGLLVGALALIVLSLGHWLRVGGEALAPGWGLPARWLTLALPPLEGLSHWHRALGPATVLLAAAAGLGAEALSRRRPALALALPALVLVDALAASQTPWPRDLVDPRPPEALAAMTAPGGLVNLPFDNARAEFAEGQARTYELWQPHHGRPIAEHYEGPDALLRRSRLIAVADALCGLPDRQPLPWRAPAELRRPEVLDGAEALAAATQGLRALGVAYVALHHDRAATPERAAALLRRALGPPVAITDGTELYAVP